MAIEVTRTHALGKTTARRQVESVAARLVDALGVRCAWEGDRLVFARKGVDGYIDVGERDVTVHVKKSRMLPVPESLIRQQIEAQLDRHFG